MNRADAPHAISNVFLQYGRVFELEELAWLEREAVALRLRQSWRQPSGAALPAVLESPDLIERGFRRLAAHPRLHDLMTAIAGASLTPTASRLRFRGPLGLAPATLHALVDLGSSPDAPRSAPDMDLRGRLHIVVDPADAEAAAAGNRLIFAASYRVGPTAAAVAPEADDCLWPTSFVLAG